MTQMILLSLICTLLQPETSTGTLVLEIRHESDGGQIRIGLYNKADGFPEDNFVYLGKNISLQKGGLTRVEIPGIPFGNYAVALHHDLNGNGKMEKNLFGVPEEPYGFSGSATGKWRQPTFSEARFYFGNSDQVVKLGVRPWEKI